MPDDPDPPRKIYGFKAREFDRANAPRPEAPALSSSNGPADALPAPAATPNPEQKIDVNELIRLGAGTGQQLGSNKVANRANDVHGVLRDNYQKGVAAGHYDLGPLDDSVRRRRIRRFWIIVVAVDVPCGVLACLTPPMRSQANAITFTFLIAAMTLVTARLTWSTFFLRTHYRD